MRSLAPLSLLAFSLSTGCGAAPEGAPQASRSLAVLEGKPSPRSGVVMVVNPVESCTGWLVLPNLVLTARHCVSPVTGGSCQNYTDAAGNQHVVAVPAAPYPAAQIGVSDEATTTLSTTFAPAAEVLTLEGAGKPADPMCGRDLALIRLVAPVAGASVIEPRVDLAPIVGESLVVVGYGQTGGGPSMGGLPDTAGARLEHDGAAVLALGPLKTALGHVRATPTEWTIDTGPCFGDSGSPALDLDGRSVGVMSRGQGSVCKDMTYGMVSAHADWLRQGVAAVAAASQIPPPAWVTAPVDHSAAMGDPCRGGSECASPLQCLPAGDHFRCTSADCAACPAGYACDPSASMKVCVSTAKGSAGSGGAGGQGGAGQGVGGQAACGVAAAGGSGGGGGAAGSVDPAGAAGPGGAAGSGGGAGPGGAGGTRGEAAGASGGVAAAAADGGSSGGCSTGGRPAGSAGWLALAAALALRARRRGAVG